MDRRSSKGFDLRRRFSEKGQFIPDAAEKGGGTYRFRQTLQAPYYQPLARQITPETWASTRNDRRQSEVARLEQTAEIAETDRGFRLRLQSSGTKGVPISVEICFREGGRLEGCTPVPGSPDAFSARARYGSVPLGPERAPVRSSQRAAPVRAAPR